MIQLENYLKVITLIYFFEKKIVVNIFLRIFTKLKFLPYEKTYTLFVCYVDDAWFVGTNNGNPKRYAQCGRLGVGKPY